VVSVNNALRECEHGFNCDKNQFSNQKSPKKQEIQGKNQGKNALQSVLYSPQNQVKTCTSDESKGRLDRAPNRPIADSKSRIHLGKFGSEKVFEGRVRHHFLRFGRGMCRSRLGNEVVLGEPLAQHLECLFRRARELEKLDVFR
jgi:hypothetical protein